MSEGESEKVRKSERVRKSLSASDQEREGVQQTDKVDTLMHAQPAGARGM